MITKNVSYLCVFSFLWKKTQGLLYIRIFSFFPIFILLVVLFVNLIFSLVSRWKKNHVSISYRSSHLQCFRFRISMSANRFLNLFIIDFPSFRSDHSEIAYKIREAMGDCVRSCGRGCLATKWINTFSASIRGLVRRVYIF